MERIGFELDAIPMLREELREEAPGVPDPDLFLAAPSVVGGRPFEPLGKCSMEAARLRLQVFGAAPKQLGKISCPPALRKSGRPK